MVSCARATRGLGRPSLDTRNGRPSSPASREWVSVEAGRASKWVIVGLPHFLGLPTRGWNGLLEVMLERELDIVRRYVSGPKMAASASMRR